MVWGREPDLAVQAVLARLAADVYEVPDRFAALAAQRGVSLVHWWCRQGTQAALVDAQDGWAALIFRGTQLTSGGTRERLRDWSVNIMAQPTRWSGPGRVHAGYLAALKRVRYEARAFAEDVSASQPLYVAGHSLGGALATGYAAWVSATVCDTRPHHVAGLVTFGAPRFGDARALSPLDQHVPVVRWIRGRDFAPSWVPWLRTPEGGVQRLPTGNGRPRWYVDHDADGYAAGLDTLTRRPSAARPSELGWLEPQTSA